MIWYCVCVCVRVRNKVEPIYKAIKKKIANGKQQPKTNKISKERSSYKRSLGVVDESVIECVLNEFIFSGFANFFYGQFDVLSIFVYPSSCLYAVISHIQHIHRDSRNSPVKTPLIPSPSPSPSMSPWTLCPGTISSSISQPTYSLICGAMFIARL